MRYFAFLIALAALGQTPVIITGPVTDASGAPFTGRVSISNPLMICGTVPVPAASRNVTITAGVLSTTLYATSDCTAADGRPVVYTARLITTSGAASWSYLTISATPATQPLSSVQTAFLPSSVLPLSQLGFGSVLDGQSPLRSGNTWIGVTPGGGGGGGSWGAITGTLANQADLMAQFNGKSDTSHTHPSLYAALVHGHAIADVTGLQGALDGKVSLSGSYANPTWLTSLGWDKVTGATTVPTISSGAGVPSSTPTKLGDVYVDTDASGLTYIADGTASPSNWRAIGGTASTANYLQSFTSQTSVALTHNAGTDGIIVQCFDGGGQEIGVNTVVKTSLTTATVTFAVAQTGSCVVDSAGGGGGGGGGGYTLPSQTGNATKALITDGSQATWQNIGQLQGRTVAATAPTDGQAMVWAAGTSQWQPGTVTGGGSITAGPTLVESPVGTYNVNGAVVPSYLAASASLTFGSILNGACADLTMTLSGALNGDSLAPGWPSAMPTGFDGIQFVSAANVVTIRLCNHSGGTVTPAAGLTFKPTILRGF